MILVSPFICELYWLAHINLACYYYSVHYTWYTFGSCNLDSLSYLRQGPCHNSCLRWLQTDCNYLRGVGSIWYIFRTLDCILSCHTLAFPSLPRTLYFLDENKVGFYLLYCFSQYLRSEAGRISNWSDLEGPRDRGNGYCRAKSEWDKGHETCCTNAPASSC